MYVYILHVSVHYYLYRRRLLPFLCLTLRYFFFLPSAQTTADGMLLLCLTLCYYISSSLTLLYMYMSSYDHVFPFFDLFFLCCFFNLNLRRPAPVPLLAHAMRTTTGSVPSSLLFLFLFFSRFFSFLFIFTDGRF